MINDEGADRFCKLCLSNEESGENVHQEIRTAQGY